MKSFILLTLLFLGSAPSHAQKEGGGGGGGVGNGGNGLDGFAQTTAKNLIPRILNHGENQKHLSEAERAALLKLCEDGIPFVAVDPASLETNRYVDKTGNPASVKITEGKRTRLLDTFGNLVDARVVYDTQEKKWIVQWDEAALKVATTSGTEAKPAFLRDVLHEVIRFGFHEGKIQRNDDDRVLSARFFIPPSAMLLNLKSGAYRKDLKKRAQELLAIQQEMIKILETDLKFHRSTPDVIEIHRANAKAFQTFLQNEKNFTYDIEGHADNFDIHERQLLLGRQTLFEQMNYGFRPLTLAKPPAGAKEDQRQAYIDQIRQRIIDLCQHRADIRETKYGAWALKKFSAGSPDSDRAVPAGPGGRQAIIDGWEKEATEVLSILKAAYRPRE